MAGCARAWRGALRRAVVVAAAVALAAGTAGASAPPGQHGSGRVGAPPPAAHAALGVSAFHPRRVRLPQRSAATRYPRNDHWPGAASGTAVLGTPPAPLVAGRHALALEPWSLGAQSNAGRTPVWAQLVTSGLHAVRVRVLPHAAALAAGVGGVAFTAAAPPGSRGGLIRLGLDYAGFARVFGGDYGLGLGLAELPACALATPARPTCRIETRLRWVNDTARQSVSALVDLPPAGGGQVVLAAVPGYTDGGGPTGNYSATTLRASGTWAAGGSSGSFTYDYPIPVPPAPSSLTPQVSLDYDSNTVNGQTAATQAQASWVGDGWSVPQSFIEQSFTSCQDHPEGAAAEQPNSSTPDDCYDGPVLTLSQEGSSTPLVCPLSSFSYTSDSQCWASNDSGEVITHHVHTHTGAQTQFDDYWTVTTRDGTTYYFGLNKLPGWQSGDKTTGSVDSLPVFSGHDPSGTSPTGDHYTDSCWNSTFSSSVCTMAYRWNLDYVTDTHGNAMAYYYHQDTNSYEENGQNGPGTMVSYMRDSHLDHIDYGFTDGHAYTGHAPDQVEFHTDPRCGIPGSGGCGAQTSGTDWPDVPGADVCPAAANPDCVYWPTFWSTVRLDKISTQQWDGSKYVTADSWALGQEFPTPGDASYGVTASLWLGSITHTGSDTTAGGSGATLPSLQFPLNPDGSGPQLDLPDRVSTSDGPPLNRFRLAYIGTETGADISVDYELTKSCMSVAVDGSPPGHLPADPATNDRSCYPVFWGPYTPGQAGAPDWFNQWVVHSVSVADPTGGSPGTFSSYAYSGAAWHYDDNELVKSKYRTYGQWRGYQQVTTTTGTGGDPQTKTVTSYYQGMDGDTPSGQGHLVVLTDSQGGQHTDYNQLAGDVLETTAYNLDGTAYSVDHTRVYSYYVSGAVQSRDRDGLPDLTANASGVVEDWAGQAVSDESPPWRVTETDTTYNTGTSPANPLLGLPLYVFRHGQVSEPSPPMSQPSQPTQPSQQACTTITYAPPNTSVNLVGLPTEVETDAVACGGPSPDGASAPGQGEVNALTAPAGVTRPDQVISDTRTFYDNPTLAQTWPQPASPAWPQPAPTLGDVSVVQQANGYANGAFTYQTKSATVYDSYGRPVGNYDANGT